MNGQPANVPILGQVPSKSACSVTALAREIDADGLIEMEGNHLARSSFVSATELVEMIRAVVREEIEIALKREV